MTISYRYIYGSDVQLKLPPFCPSTGLVVPDCSTLYRSRQQHY